MEDKLPTFIVRKRRWIEQYYEKETKLKQTKKIIIKYDNEILELCEKSNKLKEQKNKLYFDLQLKNKNKPIDEYNKLYKKLIALKKYNAEEYKYEKDSFWADFNCNINEEIIEKLELQIKTLVKRNRYVKHFYEIDNNLEENYLECLDKQKVLNNIRETYAKEKHDLRDHRNKLLREYGVDMEDKSKRNQLNF